MQNIYIIGSLTQANRIKQIAESLKGVNVRYVKLDTSKSFYECVSNCFDNIEWADFIYVVCKSDYSIGHGVTYEIEYAKRLNKQIQYYL